MARKGTVSRTTLDKVIARLYETHHAKLYLEGARGLDWMLRAMRTVGYKPDPMHFVFADDIERETFPELGEFAVLTHRGITNQALTAIETLIDAYVAAQDALPLV